MKTGHTSDQVSISPPRGIERGDFPFDLARFADLPGWKIPTGRAAPSADRERHDENYTVTTGCSSHRDNDVLARVFGREMLEPSDVPFARPRSARCLGERDRAFPPGCHRTEHPYREGSRSSIRRERRAPRVLIEAKACPRNPVGCPGQARVCPSQARLAEKAPPPREPPMVRASLRREP